MESQKRYIMIGWEFLENVEKHFTVSGYNLVKTFKVSHVQMEIHAQIKWEKFMHIFKRVLKVSASKLQLLPAHSVLPMLPILQTTIPF